MVWKTAGTLSMVASHKGNLKTLLEMSATRVITCIASIVRGRHYYNKYEKMYRQNLKKIPSLRLISNLANGEILDVGCGIGYLSSLFRNNYCGLDMSKEAANKAKKNTKREFIVASAYALPFHSEAFDTCISYDLIEHLQNIELALKEMKRISSSKVLISCIDFDSYYRFLAYDATHQRRVTPLELVAISKRFFRQVRLLGTSGLFVAPRKLNEFLSKRFPNQIVLECFK
jgi:ubiquinone/menaquinone biosynthesis C-methylase UbiE